MCSPGTQVFINGTMVKGHCLNSKSQTYAGDQWVRVEVEVRGGERLTHRIDGQTVLEYEKPTIGGGEVNNFDPAVKVDGTLLTEGYIAIQGESHPTEFRKIELLESLQAAWIRSHRSSRATTYTSQRARVSRRRGSYLASRGSQLASSILAAHGLSAEPRTRGWRAASRETPTANRHAHHRPHHPRRLLCRGVRHRRLLLPAREDEQELLPRRSQRRLDRGWRVALCVEHLERALHRSRRVRARAQGWRSGRSSGSPCSWG